MSAKVSPRRATLTSVADFDHVNPWEGLLVSTKMSPKCATLLRVIAFDHANPWEGLLVSAKMSTKCATLSRVFAFDHANPWEGLLVSAKICHFTTRSRARPRQSMVKVAFLTEASVPAPAGFKLRKLKVGI